MKTANKKKLSPVSFRWGDVDRSQNRQRSMSKYAADLLDRLPARCRLGFIDYAFSVVNIHCPDCKSCSFGCKLK